MLLNSPRKESIANALYQQNKHSQDTNFQGLNQLAKKTALPDRFSRLIPVPFRKNGIGTRKIPRDEAMGFASALVSATGFTLGGAGLFTDFLHRIKNNKANKQIKEPFKDPKMKELYGSFIDNKKEHNPVYCLSINQLEKINEMKRGCKKGDKECGVHEIKPETHFGKLGLNFAKIGIAFSGVAGFFNGIAMRIPLMSFGEAMNVASSPINEKPIGLGIFFIGLSSIFAGRALENDAALKFNPSTMANKSIWQKTGLIFKNMGLCVRELGKSSATVLKNAVSLVTGKIGGGKHFVSRTNAMNFFRDNVLAVRPSTISFNEKITASGKTIVETVMKSPPYRMHVASALLGLGGIALTATSLFNRKKAQKASLTVCQTGGSLDNIGLAYQGLEKLATKGSMAEKAAAICQTGAGVGILAGEPGVDKDYGRSLMWLGCGLLFSTFVIERGHNVRKAWKKFAEMTNGKGKEEASEFVRSWSVDLRKTAGNKSRRQFTQKGTLSNIIKAVNAGPGKERESIINKIPDKKLRENFRSLLNTVEKKLAKEGVEFKHTTGGENIGAFLEKELGKLGFDIKMDTEIRPEQLPGIKKMLSDQNAKFFTRADAETLSKR